MARRDALPIAPGLLVPARTGRVREDPVAPRLHLALLRFALPRETPATVAVFDERGSIVRTIFSGLLCAGEHDCAWDGRDELDEPVPPGSYTVRLEAAERVLTSRRVLVN